jgi:death on curing protein
MISVEIVLKLHKGLINEFGGKLGLRDIKLLESAVKRPFQTFEGKDLYFSIEEKSSALLESIINNHPFIDGKNWLCCDDLFSLGKRVEIRRRPKRKI